MNIITSKQEALTRHPVYSSLGNIDNIRHFMQYHVFAVWDFMSLLKSLQQKLTTVSIPWTPSPYPAEMVRLINQIVLGEESDIDFNGRPVSHFELYLRGMEEVGADTSTIKAFLASGNMDLIPDGAREFVKFNLSVAMEGHVVEVASSFFFGREKLIPDMFQVIVDTLRAENVQAPTFLYYLERHIEVDSGEHGPLALKALSHLTGDYQELIDLSVKAGVKALEARNELWNRVYETLPSRIPLSRKVVYSGMSHV